MNSYSPTRRLSWADRTSGSYHKPSTEEVSTEDDSDSVSVRPARASSQYKVDASAASDDDEDTSSTNSTSVSSSDTTKCGNSSEPLQDKYPAPSNTTSTYYSVTVDPANMTTNSTLIITAEQAQPDSWPVVVFGIFALLALGLCSATAIKSCKSSKRKNYDEIESLIV
jgi:hypothetical protein